MSLALKKSLKYDSDEEPEDEARKKVLSTEYRELLKVEKRLDSELERLNEARRKTSATDTMEQLHRYNDVKDATQIVIGAIARANGVTVASLHEKYDLPVDE